MGKNGKGRTKGQGVIINHADVVALEPFPYAPLYAATKAGVMAVSQNLGVSCFTLHNILNPVNYF